MNFIKLGLSVASLSCLVRVLLVFLPLGLTVLQSGMPDTQRFAQLGGSQRSWWKETPLTSCCLLLFSSFLPFPFLSVIQSCSVFIHSFIFSNFGHCHKHPLGKMPNTKCRDVTVLLSHFVEKKGFFLPTISHFNPSLVFAVSLASPSFHLYLMVCQGLRNGPEAREHVSSEVWFKMVEQFDLEASLFEDSFLSRDLPLRPQLGFGILIEPHAICSDEEICQTAEGKAWREGNKNESQARDLCGGNMSLACSSA